MTDQILLIGAKRTYGIRCFEELYKFIFHCW